MNTSTFDATVLPDLHGQDEAVPLSLFGAPSLAGESVVEESNGEPISLARAKEHLRVVVNDDDDYINSLITAARVAAEGRLNRGLVRAERVAVFANWCGAMRLPKPPFVSVDAVRYVDDAGAPQVLDPALYVVHDWEEPARITLDINTPAPLVARRPGAVRVEYTSGYAEGAVPASIIQWMLLTIGTFYDNRATVINGVTSQNLAGDWMGYLLQPYMVYE